MRFTPLFHMPDIAGGRVTGQTSQKSISLGEEGRRVQLAWARSEEVCPRFCEAGMEAEENGGPGPGGPGPAAASPAPAAPPATYATPSPGFRRANRKSWVDAMDDEDELVPLGARRSAGTTARKLTETSLPSNSGALMASSQGATSAGAQQNQAGRGSGSASATPKSRTIDGQAPPLINPAVQRVQNSLNQPLQRSSSANDTELSQAKRLEGGRNWREGDSQPMDRVALTSTMDQASNKNWFAASFEAVFKAVWWKRTFLIFDDPHMEARFQEAWGQPDRLTLPLVLFSACWSLTYVQHKTIDTWFGNKLQLGIALAVLVVPTLTMLGCYNQRATKYLRKNYHSAIYINALLPISSTMAVSIYDQIVLPPEFKCGVDVKYACPHHAMDAASFGIFLCGFAFVNMLSPCMVKYKFALNIIIAVLWTGSSFAFNKDADTPWLAAFLCINLFIIAMGTFHVGYQAEAVYRNSVLISAQLFESKQSIEHILLSMLPARLLLSPIRVPLVEHFEFASVMFCSFDKTAVLSFKNAEDFFFEMQDIYTIFDDLTEKSGLFKIEHVGEDYVVTTSNVYHNRATDHTISSCREQGACMVALAQMLVNAGNDYVSRRTGMRMGAVFKFKAGVNCGKLSAGILGRSRKFYRLFGDTVVTSARMCQSSVPGTVQISESLHHLIGDLQPARGEIRQVKMKGKGMVSCYVVNDKGGTSYDLESYKFHHVNVLGHANNLAPMPVQGGAGLCWCCIGAVSVAPEDPDATAKADESYMPALESMFEGASQPELSKVEGVSEEDDQFDDAKKFVRTVSAGFNPGKVGPINNLTGKFELKKSELMFRAATGSEFKMECREYLTISRIMGFFCFLSCICLGTNEGWTLVYEKAMWNTRDVIIPLWMGIVLAGIFFLSLFLNLLIRPGLKKKWWVINLVAAIQNIFWGAACIVAIICTNSIFTSSLPVVYLAQVASARMDPKVMFATTIPFCAAACVDAVLTEKVYVIYAILTYIITVAGVLGLVMYHRISSETTRRKLWASRQHVVAWKASMSRILCDMLPKQYAIDLVASVQGHGELTSAAQEERAVVLFSDLVGFTALNEKVSPETLINIMHHLWSCFDALVQKHGMHKIDTVGDAFIVIAIVGKDQVVEEVVNEMITLAKWMVVTLRDVSKAVGNALNIRIGIDCGMAVTGILGRLQRRFHAHGNVVSHAQKLEGLCTKGSVHISKSVAKYYRNLSQDLTLATPSDENEASDGSQSTKGTNGSSPPRKMGTLADLRETRKQFDRGTSFTKGSKDNLNGGDEMLTRATSLKAKKMWGRVKGAFSTAKAFATLSMDIGRDEDPEHELMAAMTDELDVNSGTHSTHLIESDELRKSSKMGFDEEARKLLDDVKFQAGENKTSDALRVSMVPVMVEMDGDEEEENAV